MKHNLKISVSDTPKSGGVVACRKFSLRKKLLDNASDHGKGCNAYDRDQDFSQSARGTRIVLVSFMRNRYRSRFCSLRFYTILRLVRDTISVCQRIMLCQKSVVKGFEPSHIRRRTFDISSAMSDLIAKPADMFELSVIIIPTGDFAPYSHRRCFHLLYVGRDSFFITQHITAYRINVFCKSRSHSTTCTEF